MLELISVIVRKFESTTNNYVSYKHLVQTMSISRIYLDLIIDEAVTKGYIRLDKYGDVILTAKGKMYAIENNLTK